MTGKQAEHASSKPPPHPLGPDPEFEQALDEFSEAAKRTMEALLRERVQALEERIVALAAKMTATEVMRKKQVTDVRTQVERLQTELANALARGTPPAEPAGTVPVPTPPPHRPGPARGARDSDKVPPDPTLDDVIKFLKRHGFNVDNKRPLGGGLWVYADSAEFESTKKALQSAGVGVRYHPGGRRLKPDPQFEIDPAKVLKS